MKDAQKAPGSPDLQPMISELTAACRIMEMLRASIEAGCKVNQFHFNVMEAYSEFFDSLLNKMPDDISSGKQRLHDLDQEAFKDAVKQVKDRKGISPHQELRSESQGSKRYKGSGPHQQQQQQQPSQGYGQGHGSGYGHGYGRGYQQPPQPFRQGPPPPYGRGKAFN